MAELASIKAVVTGRVQGVMFRDFTRRHAGELSLDGYVRNLPGGQTIEIEAEGERDKLEALVALVKKGPPKAAVEKMQVTWGGYSGYYTGFEIRY
jgi:acylphosphatase